MTQSIRDAAQALHDIVMQQCGGYTCGPGFEAAEKARALRAALSAPQPTADERVAELMRLVDDAVTAAKSLAHSPTKANSHWLSCAEETIEQSARALLSASQEDAEHAAMYRWLRYADLDALAKANWGDGDVYQGEQFDAAIRAAMSAKETK